LPHAYYNEIDPYAAQWLRNLISNKLIMQGEVDERPIQDVRPYELTPFTRCHFFAGIAGWDYALTLANWPVDRPVWTGSCPCQPFSTAGKRLQFDDERHLWPYWFHLISVCCPPVIFGEQVANGAGGWLDLVLADLESRNYAIGAALLPAAGVGAPHIRNRIWFVADADRESEYARTVDVEVASLSRSSWWSVESQVDRVVDGIPRAMEQLRAYGNAIVPQVAAEFVEAYLACRP
jgi:DNA (cytosine-5)-methyltransferase 1